MPPDADVPGLGAPLGPPPSAPATVEGAVGRMVVEVAFAVAVAFPVALAEPVMLADPVADPLPEADPDWLAELGAAVMVVLLEYGQDVTPPQDRRSRYLRRLQDGKECE